jgi:hypothetical protein
MIWVSHTVDGLRETIIAAQRNLYSNQPSARTLLVPNPSSSKIGLTGTQDDLDVSAKNLSKSKDEVTTLKRISRSPKKPNLGEIWLKAGAGGTSNTKTNTSTIEQWLPTEPGPECDHALFDACRNGTLLVKLSNAAIPQTFDMKLSRKQARLHVH